MTSPRLYMRSIERRFGATIALAGVDLSVAPGEIHALLGENGAGKSTLMKILSGAIRPDAGSMSLDGEDYQPRNPLAPRGLGVSMVYQELSLVPHLTVADNILLGLEPCYRGGIIRRRDGMRQVAAALERLEHPEIAADARVGDLSQAARQLVEIARALVVDARVLVLDEPTSSLTRSDTVRLFQLLGRLRDDGMSVIYISHHLEEVLQIADRYTMLRDGRCVGTGCLSQVGPADLVALMVGRELNELYPRSARHPGDIILTASQLASPPGLIDASLELRRGEVLGIAGLLGAGRSSLLRVLFGLQQVTAGTMQFNTEHGAAAPAQRLATGMGLVGEDRGESLFGSRSITDNLTLPRLGGRWGMISPGRLFELATGWIDRLAIRARDADQFVRDLSGGNQQKVALARLLHADVDVLLLDEPTRGIDVASKAQIYELVDRLATAGKAILWISSYVPELLGVADRIAVMQRGRLQPARPVAACSEHDLLLAASGGTT